MGLCEAPIVSVLPAEDNCQLTLCLEKQCGSPAEQNRSYTVKGINSNKSFSHLQDHPPKVYPSLYVYAICVKFLAFYLALRQPLVLPWLYARIQTFALEAL